MGTKESKAFTEHGVRFIYLSLLIAIPFGVVAIAASLLSFTASIASLGVGTLLVLMFFIKGMGGMLNGREEMGEQHTSNVILATILSSAAIVVFLFLLLLVIISVNVIVSSLGSTDSTVALVLALILPLALSIAFLVLIGLGLIFFIKEIMPDEKKSFLWISLGLTIASPIITSIFLPFGAILRTVVAFIIIIPMALFFFSYKAAYMKLRASAVKAVPLLPCPFCDKIIPTNSTSCRHCGAKFEEDEIEELDPRLNMDAPEPQHVAPRGYTPVKGPSESQKRRLFTIISLIIVLIIVAAAIFVIFRGNEIENNKNSFVGTWNGGIYDGENFFTDDTWIFHTNGSIHEEDSIFDEWGTYEIKSSSEICISLSYTSNICYDYKFLNNGMQFQLILGNEPLYQFTKVE